MLGIAFVVFVDVVGAYLAFDDKCRIRVTDVDPGMVDIVAVVSW